MTKVSYPMMSFEKAVMNGTWYCPAKTTRTAVMEESWIISLRPLSPNLDSTFPPKSLLAISTAAFAESWVRLQMDLRLKRCEISESLGRYWCFTNVPAPRIAICIGAIVNVINRFRSNPIPVLSLVKWKLMKLD